VSVQSDIEAALVTLLAASIPGLTAIAGATTIPTIEGKIRYATVSKTGGTARRLEYGQLDWSEDYAIVIYWNQTIARATRITEWETVSAALLADNFLGGAVAGLADAYLTEVLWREAHDAGIVAVSAVVTVERIE